MNLLQSLNSLSNYPIKAAYIELQCAENGLDVNADLTPEIAKSQAYKNCKAYVYRYLAIAPNISQGGISFAFNADERKAFRKLAEQLLEGGDEGVASDYGYCGSDL